MANERPTDFTSLTGANLSLSDLFVGVDVSDTTDNAAGSDMYMTGTELRTGMRRLFSIPVPAIGTEQETNTSNTTWVDVSGVSWSVTSGRHYYVKVGGIYQTAATTTGIQFRFNSPSLTRAVNRFSVRQAANGTDSWYETGSTDLTQNAASASVVAANTDYAFFGEAFFTPSANGTLQLQFRSEINTSQVTVQTGCYGMLFDIAGT